MQNEKDINVEKLRRWLDSTSLIKKKIHNCEVLIAAEEARLKDELGCSAIDYSYVRGTQTPDPTGVTVSAREKYIKKIERLKNSMAALKNDLWNMEVAYKLAEAKLKDCDDSENLEIKLAVVYIYYFAGLSIHELCEKTDYSVSSVKRFRKSALQKLTPHIQMFTLRSLEREDG